MTGLHLGHGTPIGRTDPPPLVINGVNGTTPVGDNRPDVQDVPPSEAIVQHEVNGVAKVGLVAFVGVSNPYMSALAARH